VNKDDRIDALPLNYYTFAVMPAYIGYYCIGGNFKIAMTRKPAWAHRFMMRWCFGWAWEDAL